MLETARLRLRPFRASDLPTLLAYRNDPEVARYQDWEGMTESEGRAFIAEQSMARPGVPGAWFQLAAELRATNEHVGDCALRCGAFGPRQAEIGFSFARGHQRRGLATEAVCRLLDYAFADLGLHRVVALTDCRNAACAALLERVGMRREGHFREDLWFKGAWADDYLYAVLESEWAGRGGKAP